MPDRPTPLVKLRKERDEAVRLLRAMLRRYERIPLADSGLIIDARALLSRLRGEG